MKRGLIISLFCLIAGTAWAQTDLDQYNSQYVLAVQAHIGDPSEANLNMKAIAAFQLYYYHLDGYRKNDAERYKADALSSWQQLEDSEELDFKLSASIGLGSIHYMEGFHVKRGMEDIALSDREAYSKATKELNRLMNLSYQYLKKGDELLPTYAKERLTTLEQAGASNSRIDELRERFYNDYVSILDTMTKLFAMSNEMQLYNDYKDRLAKVEQGELYLAPHPDLPDQLFFN